MEKHNQVSQPRMTLQFSLKEGNEQFGWGVTGQIPSMSLIGAIKAVQTYIATELSIDKNLTDFKPGELVIEWNTHHRQFSWRSDPNIPKEPLLGMLDVIKSLLIDSEVAKIAEAMVKQQQTGLVDITGKPVLARR